MLRNQFHNLFYPPEVLAPEGKPASPKTADDINDLFKTLDTEESQAPPEKKEPKAKEKEVEEPEEQEEDDELDLIEPDEDIEKLDLKSDDEIDIEAPPRKREILKEYPELFKKFPFLEKMMYRDRQITELFGSFDDAKAVAEKSESFNNFESQLLAGNTEEILRGVKDSDEKAFNIIVDDYLPTLAKVDKEAYFQVVGNLNRRLIIEMVQESNDLEKSDPERAADLKQAALYVNQFVFGTAKFTAPILRVDKKEITEQSAADKDRLEFTKERYEIHSNDIDTRVDNTLRATINDYIDPKGNMSAYEKKNAVADAMKILISSMISDESFIKNRERLWRDSFDKKFTKESLGKIQSYYLSKAKPNIKNAILKARAEVLKNTTPRAQREKEVDEDVEETPRRPARTISPGRPSTPKSKSGPAKGESVTDFFMKD